MSLTESRIREISRDEARRQVTFQEFRNSITALLNTAVWQNRISEAVMIEAKKGVPTILSTAATVLIPVLTQDECKKTIPKLVQSALSNNNITVKVINNIVESLMAENEKQIKNLVKDPAKNYVTPLLDEMRAKYNKEFAALKNAHAKELEKIKIKYSEDVKLATRIAVVALIVGLASLGFLLAKC